MKKKDLQKEIDDLRKRVADIEKRPYANPYTFTLLPPYTNVPYVPPVGGGVTIGDPIGPVYTIT